MSFCRQGEVSRDGFASIGDRFYPTTRGQIERVDGASLRRMFLPSLTKEGKKMLSDKRDFVWAQLQHYAISYDEKKLTGNGTMLLKKVLQEGKCDVVPAHLLALQEQLHREWLDTKTPEDLAAHPDWFMDKYFMQGVGADRQPDRSRTTTVIGAPFPGSSEYRSGQMREAAQKVEGLYHEMSGAAGTQTIFMGWDSAAVKAAVAGNADKKKKEAEKEKKEQEAQEKKRKAERTKLHKDYLKTLKKGSRKAKPSPVGSYIVDCEDIEGGWSDTDDLTLDIHDTDEPGVFHVCFDFAILEGIMLIGTNETVLEEYCSKMDGDGYGDYSDEGDSDDDDEEEDDRPKAGSKRKAPSGGAKKAAPKKAKPGKPRSTLTYRLKSRCRDTGEGQIYSNPDDGTIKFTNGDLAAFTGEAGFPAVGRNVPFTARKISDTPCSQREEWADYSDEAAERANISRW